MIQRTTQKFVQSVEPVESVLLDFIEELPEAFQYPEITAVKVKYGESEVQTENFVPSDRRLTSQTKTADGTLVRIDIVYLEERPQRDDGPFLAEEQSMLDVLATLVGDYIERKN